MRIDSIRYLIGDESQRTADARFNNDEVGASAYGPRVMPEIVLLAYSRGLISSRKIEQACVQNVLFIALSGDSHPQCSFATLRPTLISNARRGSGDDRAEEAGRSPSLDP